ncbi:MAG: hypothetical protein IKY25_00480 [Alistipes sp.]|nr:hypothetical protein [Alistipes sp.]
MDYKELTRRYLSAQTTLEEEAELLKSRPAVSDTEGRAIEAMIYHAQKQRQESVAIRMHEPRRGWQMVAALAASVVMLLGIFHLTKPQTIYGYYNGEPVTSLAEAEQMTEELFGNMLLAESGAEGILEDMFYLNY